jgi:hypothetical protein
VNFGKTLLFVTLLLGLGPAVARAQDMSDEDCMARVRRIICVSESSASDYDPACNKKSVPPEWLAQFPNLITELPPVQREVFCHLNRLQIQPNLSTLAYAAEIKDARKNVVGNLIGLRPSLLLAQTPRDMWSWKEQLVFGLTSQKDAGYALRAAGPRVELSIADSKSDYLLIILTHELSHLIDFMNNVFAPECERSADSTQEKLRVTCHSPENSFARLSWPFQFSGAVDGSEWPPKEFVARTPLLAGICYYGCKSIVPLDAMSKMYKELRGSSFFTSYSAANPSEDFAESSAIVALKNRGLHYKIIGPQHETLFDLQDFWDQPQMAQKRRWLENFYAQKNLLKKIEPPVTKTYAH